MRIRNERTKKRLAEQEHLLKTQREAKLNERMTRQIVYGVKKPVHRSQKTATKKKEEKKQDLTQEEIDHNKYLGQLAAIPEEKGK